MRVDAYFRMPGNEIAWKLEALRIHANGCGFQRLVPHCRTVEHREESRSSGITEPQ